jgi:hypothetical protein
MKKRHIAKLTISENVFCGFATRSVNILIEMLTAENNIRYGAVIDSVFLQKST